MNRLFAQALVEQMGREVRGTPHADFDYTWWRERVQAVTEQCRPEDRQAIWQCALWQLDALGLLPGRDVRRH